MHRTLSKKAVVATAIALVVVAITAAAAFAAPVLKPGTTSAPGMSGTCTHCHKYAKTTSSKSTVVSHPYVAKGRHRPGHSLKVWGYIAPKLSNTSETTLTILVQKKVKGSWVTSDTLATTGTVTAKGKFRHKTNYHATLHLPKGDYRLRAQLVYLDSKSIEQTATSQFLRIRIHR